MPSIFDPIKALKAYREPSSVRTTLWHGAISSGNPDRITGDQLPFTEFVPRSKQYAGGSSDDLGFHLGTTDQATIRSREKMSLQRDIGGEWITGHKEEFHVNIKNPIQAVKDAGDWTDPKLVSDVLPKKYSAKTIEGIRKNLIEGGYDGVVYKNLHERMSGENPENSFIVFDPRQVKSASRNVGTYDPTNPDFTKALIPAGIAGGASSALAESMPESQKVSRTKIFDPIRSIKLKLLHAAADKTGVGIDQNLPVRELPPDQQMALTSPEEANPFSRIQKDERQVPTRETQIADAEKQFARSMFGTPVEIGSHVVGASQDIVSALKEPSLTNWVFASAGLIPGVGFAKKIVRKIKRLSQKDTQKLLAPDKNMPFVGDLPMSASARRDRASRLGWDVDAHHGTSQQFYEFDANLLGASTGADAAKKGFFFSKGEPVAEGFARSAAEKFPRPETVEKIKEKEKYIKELHKIRGRYTPDNFRGSDIFDFFTSSREPVIRDRGRRVDLTSRLHTHDAEYFDLANELDDQFGISTTDFMKELDNPRSIDELEKAKMNNFITEATRDYSDIEEVHVVRVGDRAVRPSTYVNYQRHIEGLGFGNIQPHNKIFSNKEDIKSSLIEYIKEDEDRLDRVMNSLGDLDLDFFVRQLKHFDVLTGYYKPKSAMFMSPNIDHLSSDVVDARLSTLKNPGGVESQIFEQKATTLIGGRNPWEYLSYASFGVADGETARKKFVGILKVLTNDEYASKVSKKLNSLSDKNNTLFKDIEKNLSDLAKTREEMDQIKEADATVMKVKLRMEDPKIIYEKDINWPRVGLAENIENAKIMGHDGVILKGGSEDWNEIYVVFRPEQVRSVDARFDPELTPASTKSAIEKYIKPRRRSFYKKLEKKKSSTEKEIKLLKNEIHQIEEKRKKHHGPWKYPGDKAESPLEQQFKAANINLKRLELDLDMLKSGDLKQLYYKHPELFEDIHRWPSGQQVLSKRRDKLSEAALPKNPVDRSLLRTKKVDTPAGPMILNPKHLLATVPPVMALKSQRDNDN